MSTFVLIHGAWHGGWCWWKLAPLLSQSGNSVYAPSLTGMGERSHLPNTWTPQPSIWTFILRTLRNY